METLPGVRLRCFSNSSGEPKVIFFFAFIFSLNIFRSNLLKALRERLNAKKKITFGSPEELKRHLNLTPGSVSIFGMIYSKDVELTLSRKLNDIELSSISFKISAPEGESEWLCSSLCGDCDLLDAGETKKYYLFSDSKPDKIIIGADSCQLVSADIGDCI